MVEKSEHIIKLVDNELSAKEKNKLEKELYKNPKLMQEYLTQIQLNDFLRKKFGANLSEKKNRRDSKSSGENGLDFETEAFKTGAFLSATNLLEELKDESISKNYSDELKEFSAIGIVEKSKQASTSVNLRVVGKENIETKKGILTKWYFIATSVAAMLVISFILYRYNSAPVSNAELFSSYYQSYHFVKEQTRGSDLTIDSLVEEATELYKSKKYSKAFLLIIDALELNAEHVKARFLHGLTLLEEGHYSNAANEFNSILSGYDSYNIESRWYLALCYLKLENTREAEKLLRELGQSKNLYQKRALEILKKMD